MVLCLSQILCHLGFGLDPYTQAEKNMLCLANAHIIPCCQASVEVVLWVYSYEQISILFTNLLNEANARLHAEVHIKDVGKNKTTSKLDTSMANEMAGKHMESMELNGKIKFGLIGSHPVHR